jgi:uncharacterized delta-60 repeat protein
MTGPRLRTRRLLQVAAGVVTLLALPLAASAAGELDAGFGGGGKVITDLGGDDVALAVATQPDGKTVIGGETIVAGTALSQWLGARDTETGALDPTFDGDGIVVTPFADPPAAVVFDLALQPDGKIVAVGEARGSSLDLTVLRYNPDGSLDPSFGSGGKVLTDFGTPAAATVDGARAVALSADGKIVVAGLTRPLGRLHEANFALARYNADGSLDSSFGAGGRVVTDFGGNDSASDLGLRGDGKIVAAGLTGGAFFSDPHIALARYTASGTPDTTFAGTGRLVSDAGYASSILLDPGGKIVLAGSRGTGTPPDALLMRLDASGSLDASFGSGGKADAGAASLLFTDLAFDQRGRILAVGAASGPNDFAPPGTTRTVTSMEASTTTA